MKRIKVYKRFGIYERTDKEIAEASALHETQERFCVFLPDESPRELCEPEWECGTIKEATDFIDSY